MEKLADRVRCWITYDTSHISRIQEIGIYALFSCQYKPCAPNVFSIKLLYNQSVIKSWNMPSNVMVDELYNRIRVSLINMCGIMKYASQLLATCWIMTPQLLTKHHCTITLPTLFLRHDSIA